MFITVAIHTARSSLFEPSCATAPELSIKRTSAVNAMTENFITCGLCVEEVWKSSLFNDEPER
jgi:hypothetical protein